MKRIKKAFQYLLIAMLFLQFVLPIHTFDSWIPRASAATQSKTFPESTSQTQTQTWTIPYLKSVNNVSVNTGTVTYSVSDDTITFNLSGGTYSRRVQTGGSYTPSDSKTASDSRTSSSNDLPSSISYSSGGYSGTLYGQGVNQTVISGSPAGSKTATGSRSVSYSSSKSCSHALSELNSQGPSTISYSDPQGYSGTLSKSGLTSSSCEWSDGLHRASGTMGYSGTVSKPDTRVYQYSQSYSGTVTKPASDTRTWQNYYQYTVNLDYTDNAVPTLILATATDQVKSDKTGYKEITLSGTVNDADLPDTVTVKYQVDSAAAQTIQTVTPNGNDTAYGPLDVTVGSLPEGPHTIKVWAEDNRNGVSSPSIINFVVDNTGPTIDVSMINEDGTPFVDNTWTHQNVNVTSSFSDPVAGVDEISEEFSLDGGTSWGAYTPFKLMNEGTHSIQVRAKDKVGNENTAQKTVKIERDKPTISVTMTKEDGSAYDGISWTDQPVSVSASFADSTSGINTTTQSISLDGGVLWQDFTGPVEIAADGETNVKIRVKDNAGNETIESRSVKIDRDGPSISVIMKSQDGSPYTNNEWSTEPITVEAVFSDAVSGVDTSTQEYSLDNGGTWERYMTPFLVNQDGTHDIKIRAKDNSGKVTTESRTLKIDNGDPEIIVTMLNTNDWSVYTNNTWTKNHVKITFRFNDHVSGIEQGTQEYSLDGGSTWHGITRFTSVLVESEGVTHITVRVKDKAGRIKEENRTIMIETIPPTFDFVLNDGNDPIMVPDDPNEDIPYKVSITGQSASKVQKIQVSYYDTFESGTFNEHEILPGETEYVGNIKQLNDSVVGRNKTIFVRLVTVAGNTSDVVSKQIFRNVRPEVTASLIDKLDAAYPVFQMNTDDNDGDSISKAEIQINGPETKTINVDPFVSEYVYDKNAQGTLADGDYTADVAVFDEYNLKSGVQQVVFRMDTRTNPSDFITIPADQNPNPNEWIGLDKLIFTYETMKKMNNTVEIRTPANDVVRSLPQGIQPAGLYQVTWDGKNDQGTVVPSGPYKAVLISFDGENTYETPIGDVKVDTKPPVVTIGNNQDHFNTDTIPIHVVIDEDSDAPLTGTIVVKDKDGNVVDSWTIPGDLTNNELYDTFVPPTEGEYAVIVDVEDSVGNKVTEQREYIFDKTKPVISSILYPPNTEKSEESITVTVEDLYGIAAIQINGDSFSVQQNGQYYRGSGTVTLREGQNDFTIVAIDEAGNTSQEVVSIHYVIPLKRIVVSPSSATMFKDESMQLTATAEYGDGRTEDVTSQASWSGSGGAVSVSGGNVTAQNIGSSGVIATFKGVSGSASITVSEPPPVPPTMTGIRIEPRISSMSKSEIRSFKAMASYSDGSKRDVTDQAVWAISDEIIAELKGSKLRAIEDGIVSISATANGLSDTLKIEIGKKPVIRDGGGTDYTGKPADQITDEELDRIIGDRLDEETLLVQADQCGPMQLPTMQIFGGTLELIGVPPCDSMKVLSKDQFNQLTEQVVQVLSVQYSLYEQAIGLQMNIVGEDGSVSQLTIDIPMLARYELPSGANPKEWGLYQLNMKTGAWELMPTFVKDDKTIEARIDGKGYYQPMPLKKLPVPLKTWATDDFEKMYNMRGFVPTAGYDPKGIVTMNELLTMFDSITDEQQFSEIVDTVDSLNLHKDILTRQELTVLANHVIRTDLEITLRNNPSNLEEKRIMEFKLNDNSRKLNSFVDAQEVYEHYVRELSIATNYNLLMGKAGYRIAPNDTLTREEAVAFLIRYAYFSGNMKYEKVKDLK